MAAPSRVSLRIPYTAISIVNAPLWVAQEGGYLAEEGIDAAVEYVATSTTLTQAMLAGEVAVADSGQEALVAADLAGADLVAVAVGTDRFIFRLFGAGPVRTIPDLRGQRVGITRYGSTTDTVTRLLLKRNGLDPDRDVTLIQVGSTNDSLTAMLSGAVAAGMLSPPGMFRADDQGLRLLVDTGDYHYPFILQGIATSRSWLAKNEDLARRTLQALAEGLAFAHQHKERTKEIVGQYTKVDDPVLLEKTYTALVPGFERTLYAPPEALRADLEALAEEIPAARDARPEQFLDTRLVEELDRGGFFQRLYQ